MSYRFKGEKIIIEGNDNIIVPSNGPQSPSYGSIKIDSITNEFCIWNIITQQWDCLKFKNINTGSLFHLIFTENGSAKNKWLENNANSLTSNETPGVIPFACELVAITYSNEENDSDTNIKIYKANVNNGNNSSNVYEWQIRNARTAYKNNIENISFDAGDKIGIYLQDAGSDVHDVVIILYFRIISEGIGENMEEWSYDL